MSGGIGRRGGAETAGSEGPGEVAEGSQPGARLGPGINDFAIKVATVNGTGSASANGLLRRAIFRMGIPVSGKNLFPSNIQGLPTWYEIRVNDRGHLARTPRFDLMVANRWSPIDPVYLALSLGATFVARSFSGDKEQLVPILKAGIAHRGLAPVDVISPCVTFNDHRGSTKSYAHTREHDRPVGATDFVPVVPEIALIQARGTVRDVRLHDGSLVRLRKVDESYDPTDRTVAYEYLREREKTGEMPTGLLFLDADDFHTVKETADAPLYDLPFEELCPGSDALDAFQDSLR